PHTFDTTAPPTTSSLLPGDGHPPSSGISSLPPTLSPIARVSLPESQCVVTDRTNTRTSVESRPSNAVSMSAPADNWSYQKHQQQQPTLQQQQRPSPLSFRSMDSGFIGGVALQKYRQAHASPAQQHDADGPSGAESTSSSQRHCHRERPIPAPINTSIPTTQQLLQHSERKPAVSSFVTPTDLNSPPSSGSVPASRRHASARMVSEPAALPTKSSSQTEPQKTRKGLPFLKNPMSTLLMRRKASQNVPDMTPLPLSVEKEEPVYDPRIRGTRVHDFSAPRRREAKAAGMPVSPQIVTTPYAAASASASVFESEASPHLGSDPSEVTLGRSSSTVATKSPPSTATSSESQDALVSPAVAPPAHSGTRANSRSYQQPQQQPQHQQEDAYSMSTTLPYRNVSVSTVSTAATPSRMGSSATPMRSRNVSDVSMMSGISGLPKHMKSTSSRFSFDMIGAAKQEKAMEERHRQHQAEKGGREEPVVNNARDSRFDDFDEDSFDYDAMMDDDGLEERIPGVNADYDDYDDGFFPEEEVDDPDNDQENFAGFSFQRSEGNLRGLASKTLDDEVGSGSFKSKSTARQSQLQESPLPPVPEKPAAQPQQEQQMPKLAPAGLGIEGMNVQELATQQAPSASTDSDNKKQPGQVDDLYYDDGVVGFEGEFAEDLARPPSWDATPFDESIFDNNDTDQYGRPIAGAFAQAQSERQATLRGSIKRESDLTSRFSEQSEVTRSTAHTSLSTGTTLDKGAVKKGGVPEVFQDMENAPLPDQNPMVAYQAALAAAARKAAATGKFQRGGEDPSAAEHHDGADGDNNNNEDNNRYNVDGGDDGSHDDYDKSAWKPDEYEADKDDYEFGGGFENMDDFELDDDAIIAEANASALANDPNLTPITERSEYSNRNSVMSMTAFPGGPTGGFGTPIQSPGLAQLALMSDTNEEMSLSSLMRLRSKAWGGSQASASQVSSQAGSPKSERGDTPHSPWAVTAPHSPWAVSTAAAAAAAAAASMHGRKGSCLNFDLEGGGADSLPSPTLIKTMSAPGGGVDPDHQSTLPSPSMLARRSASEAHRRSVSSGFCGTPADEMHSPSHGRGGHHHHSPVSPVASTAGSDAAVAAAAAASRRSGLGHSLSHQSRSSADSVSYSIEEEESGETRWILERRRVVEAGHVEMEREVVEGGRI
ncbi:hypothetical protein GMORB2_1168, partial [Geosmithia morbida]